MRTLLSYALLSVVCMVVSSVGAEVRRATICWDGVAAFPRADVRNALDAQLRRPASSADVARESVFLHPLDNGVAWCVYDPVSKARPAGEQRFFIGYVGISDGFDWEDKKTPPDGVRFHVLANGVSLLEKEVVTPGWQPMAAPLDSGAIFRMALGTDSGDRQSSSYDWALFGDPMVVSVSELAIVQGVAVAGTGGVVIAELGPEGGDIVVEGLDVNGNPLPAAQAGSVGAPGSSHTFVLFDFSTQRECVAWRWRARAGAVLTALGGSWEPRLTLESVGPARAVTFADEPWVMRVTVRNDGMGALLESADVSVVCAGFSRPLGALAPAETTEVDIEVGRAGEGLDQVVALITGADAAGQSRVAGPFSSWPRLPVLPEASDVAAYDLNDDYSIMQNGLSRWVVSRQGMGALIYVRCGDVWELAGTVSPWFEWVGRDDSSTAPRLNVAVSLEAGSPRLVATHRDAERAFTMTADLAPGKPGLQVACRIEAVSDVALSVVRGPAVHAGDRAGGSSKGIAIFPGLEYLDGDERSSSTRDLAPPLHERWTPHKFKITVPMMLVETRPGGPVLGIAWDATQAWDGQEMAPAVRFASPDFLNRQDNHLMQLMLPSVPDGIRESASMTPTPWRLTQGETWVLNQTILAAVPQPDVTMALRWYDDLVGFPAAAAPPRSFTEETALCRHGFMETLWDDEAQGGRHCVGWAALNSPGFATLLLADARNIASGEERERVRTRVDLIGKKTVADEGYGGLASSACCHTLAWEFPFHWGHLPGALQGMRTQAYVSLNSQEEDGLWGFQPGKDQARLGERGVRTMGICGRNAYLMAKYAAISGDPEVMAGLRRALAGMARFRVPRGAQGWECPMLQPDVLASAYALRAYVWTVFATGETQWLEPARFWARTGLPFQYAWDDGDHPGMRYASIPVFGSTFYTHTWIGLPVQWCGLVYAYALQEFMRLEPDDLWRRQVEGMTVSAMWQQWPMDNAELAGSYPDSYGKEFTQRNPAFINPENIQLNLLALNGFDPGLRSTAVKTPDGLIHVTAPGDIDARLNGGELRVNVRYVPNETLYVSFGCLVPGAGFSARQRDETLPERDDLAPGVTGWTLVEPLRITVVGMTCDAQGSASVRLTGFARQEVVPVPGVSHWEFAEGVEGWQSDHSCTLRHADGAMTIRVSGDDAYAVSGPAVIRAADAGGLRARVRLSKGESVGLFWRSSVSPGWGPDKTVGAPVAADGQWHEIEFDLGAHSLWSGTIQQIRFDVEPSGVPSGTTLDVDWVRPLR